MKRLLLLLTLTTFSLHYIYAQEEVNEEMVDLIKKHGIDQSQVMDIANWVIDIHGPRLTGSPGLDRATEWAVNELKSWGMDNVHLEEWGPFGRGWELDHFEMHAYTPAYWPVIAYPKAWSPSTAGEVEGELIYLDADDAEDLAKYKGQLQGKIVLFDTIRTVREWYDGTATRLTDEQLLNRANASMPTPRPRRGRRSTSGFSFNQQLRQFLLDEQPLAILDRSYKGDQGTVFVSRATTAKGRPWDENNPVVPQVTVAVEHYNRLLRLTQQGIKTKVKLNLKSQYTNPDGMEHNIIAEIPGTDLKDEVVIFGAHFDSWHAATGATDNGAGSSVMMEAARILLETIKESGVQPRRTLRLALWTGEEQGLYGSRAYVSKHFAEVDPGGYTPQSLKPEQEKVAAYFNLDNGTGKVRGVYLQGNQAVAPIFRSWLKPFKDMDASTLTLSNTGGTDHLAFDGVGIPGFQFIQDPIAYGSRTHHSNMDNLDHLEQEDLAQAATVIAHFVWHTAMRDEQLPRKATDLKVKKDDKSGRR